MHLSPQENNGTKNTQGRDKRTTGLGSPEEGAEE